MGKKKIIGLCLAVGLMVGVVGGSLAWFTDSATKTNSFSTQGDNEGATNGIEIVETTWNEENGKNILPGTEVAKSVQVKNNATYDQYMRVKLTKVWKDKDGNVIDKVGETKLNTELIQLNFGENLGTKAGQWTDKTKQKDGITGGYYYYNGIVGNGRVESEELTNKLLESVTLSKDTGSIYKDLKFDVIVDAEGIQSENGAAQDAWGYTPGAAK